MSSFVGSQETWAAGFGGAPPVAEIIAATTFPRIKGLAKQLPGTDQNLTCNSSRLTMLTQDRRHD